jgi:hypothetical protein
MPPPATLVGTFEIDECFGLKIVLVPNDLYGWAKHSPQEVIRGLSLNRIYGEGV